MAILRGPKTWTRPRPATETRRASDLTPEEQANVKRALRVLVRRTGTLPALAATLNVNPRTLRWYIEQKGRPSAGVALRAARLAGIAVEDLLAGRWPVDGACP